MSNDNFVPSSVFPFQTSVAWCTDNWFKCREVVRHVSHVPTNIGWIRTVFFWTFCIPWVYRSHLFESQVTLSISTYWRRRIGTNGVIRIYLFWFLWSAWRTSVGEGTCPIATRVLYTREGWRPGNHHRVNWSKIELRRVSKDQTW